jgi:hypothetical protein
MTSRTSKIPYVLSLAGIASNKKVSTRNATSFSVFCGMKLQEENNGELSSLFLKCFY